MARIGYARVSTRDQHPEAQRERLEEAGCTRIYTDHGASGVKASRPEWDKCLDRLEKGDALVCVKLDRIGRSVRNLMDVIGLLEQRGVNLQCLDQPIDTTSAMGKMLFTILAAFAEFEHDLIVERTMDGLAASTKPRDRNGGRRHRLTPSSRRPRASSAPTGTASGRSAPCSATAIRSPGRLSTGRWACSPASPQRRGPVPPRDRALACRREKSAKTCGEATSHRRPTGRA